MAKLIVAVSSVQKAWERDKEISSKFSKQAINLMAEHLAPKAGATQEELEEHKEKVERKLQKVKTEEEASFEETMLPVLEAFTGLKNISFEIEGENFVIDVNDKIIVAYVEETGIILQKILPVVKAMLNLYTAGASSIKYLLCLTFEKK
jgi:hypothetical protein